MPKVNPNILVWARQTAGLTVDEAARKLRIQHAYGKPPKERLHSIESGQVEPKRSLLLKMSKQYRRSLLVFYMSEPPKKGNRGKDFRTLPDDYTKREDSLVDALVRDILVRQSIVRNALEEEEEFEALTFIGAFDSSDDFNEIKDKLRKIIGFNLTEFRNQPSPTKAFELLRNKVQTAGVYVLLMGDLGSHHTSIDVDAFRGFSLADDLCSLIIINDKDSRAAWSFTLIHEMVHLLLGKTGISGGKPESDIENLCDQIASELLLPTGEINRISIDKTFSLEEIKNAISSFAYERNISNTMVAYHLYKSDKINQYDYSSLQEYFRNKWEESREKKSEKAREREGGPSYYIVSKHRLGSPLIKLVNNMRNSGALSTSKAGKVLGVKTKNVDFLFKIVRKDNFALKGQ